MVKLISHNEILNLNITAQVANKWVDNMLANKHKVVLPPKISMKMDNGMFYNVMPSIIKEDGIAGVKIVNRYKERIPSLDSQIMLYDFNSGELISVMDGNYVTAIRTGAVAAHSIELLAKKDYKSIGFIGVGNTARATLECLLARTDRKLKVNLYKYKDQEKDFMERFGERNIEFECFSSYEDVITNSDVIVSAITYTGEDLCDISCFKKGCTVIPIHTRGFQCCDLAFDKVYADDRGHVEGFKYFDKFKQFSEVSDVVAGKTKGRENDDERILVYNIGLSMHDIYFAGEIYKLSNNCTEYEFSHPKEKFWI